MRFHNKGLTDDFEIHALWTIEDYDIQGIVGTLSYSQNKILLDLPNIDKLNLSEKVCKVSGETRTKIISLYNLRVIGKYSNTLSHTKFIADCMVVDSKPVESLEDFRLKSVTFAFDYLPLLFNKSNWKSGRETNSIINEETESKLYKINSLNATLTEGYSSSEGSSITSKEGLVITLKTIPYLKIEYSEEQSIMKIKEDVFRIRNLLTILCGEALTLTSFSFDSEDRDIVGNAVPIKGKFYFSQLTVSREYKQFMSAYEYNDIINNFSNILTNYFKSYTKLQPIVQNITINTAMKNLAETQFNDAITSLEVYHREFYKEHEETTVEKETTKREILSLIDELHENEYERNELKNIVKEIDRVNLTKRVKQLLKDMPGNLKEEIIFQDLDFSKNKVVSDFAYKCSSTRNYHAHGSKNPKNNIYETIDLIHLTKILNLVSEFYLMKQIGLDSEVIIKGLFNKKSHQVVLAV